MRRRHVITVVVTLVLAACGGSSGGGGSDQASADGGTHEITVGVIPILDVAPIYLGVQEGFFEERGLDVTLELAQGGAAIVPAVVSGQFAFGFSNNTSLLLARAQGLPLRVVAPGSASTGVPGDDYTGLVVPPGSSVQTPADLAGGTVAINTLNNIGDTVVREAVRNAGGDPATVEFVELPFPDMPAALQQNRIDAAFVSEPFLTITEQQGARDVSSVYAETAPDLSVANWFTSEGTLQDDPELVDAFTAAMTESQAYATANPEAARQVLSTYTQISEDLVPLLTLPAWPERIDAGSVQVLADLALEDGLVDERPDVDALLP